MSRVGVSVSADGIWWFERKGHRQVVVPQEKGGGMENTYLYKKWLSLYAWVLPELPQKWSKYSIIYRENPRGRGQIMNSAKNRGCCIVRIVRLSKPTL